MIHVFNNESTVIMMTLNKEIEEIEGSIIETQTKIAQSGQLEIKLKDQLGWDKCRMEAIDILDYRGYEREEKYWKYDLKCYEQQIRARMKLEKKRRLLEQRLDKLKKELQKRQNEDC